MMADNTWWKLLIKPQSPLGGIQFILFTVWLISIFSALKSYHHKDRLNFSCDPKPSDFNRNTCYNNYIDMISKPHGIIPVNVVFLTWTVLLSSWIFYVIFAFVLIRKINSSRDNDKTKKILSCSYFIHVFFRIFFLGGMLGLSCSYPTIDLPSTYKCEVHQTPQNNDQTTQSSIHPTKMTLYCNDLHYKQKSMLNRVVIAVDALFMLCGILEVLYMWCTEGPVWQKFLGDLETVELGLLLESLPEKPTITTVESEVDKDFTVTWSEIEANNSNCSINYRLEWTKQPMTPLTLPDQRGNIVETHYKITGLEYDAEYEVKLFAVNKQGDSEPDVRTFKTKSAISVRTTVLKTSIINQTEFQPKLFASHTISEAKTDEVFTNLLIQRGRKAIIGNGRTNTRREALEYYQKVSGTPVKHCDEIFFGTSDDQKNPSSILVVGKAGIGKSLFCQKVVRDWAKNQLFETCESTQIPNFKLVYLVTFRDLNGLENTCVTLREFLDHSSVLSGICMDNVSFEYIVNHPEEVLIILDGYDEYSQKDYLAGNLEKEYLNDARYKMPAAAFCSKLIRGKILKGSVVVVTTRPEEMNKLGGIRFEQFVEIKGFSSEQVKEFIEKYFKENEKVKNAVLEHVMNNENLVSFAHIPMLCYLLCFEMEYILNKTENPDDLPVSMTDIYTKLIDIFVLKHCADSEYRQNEMPEKFEPLPVIKNTLEKLSELAAKLLLESKPTFDESGIEGGFELEEVNKLIGSGLLYCVKTFRTGSTETTKHFSFIHLTVQEYLAARWFVKENRIPDKKCSAVVFQFMAGILSRERNGELMEELLTSGQGLEGNTELLRAKCLSEYKDEEFAQQFIRNHSIAICNSHGEIFLDDLSNVDCIAVSFVLDIISELNKEEAGKAQHKCSDKFIAVKTLRLFLSRLTLSGIQRVCNSLINEHCLVSELNLLGCNLADECVDVMEGLVLSKLTTLDLSGNNITETGVASLCEALQHQSCKLTTLGLGSNEITDTGVASLCEALQHSSCKLTTLDLSHNEITDTGVASLCKALQHPSCKLTTLDLRGEITDTGVASLCEALQHPSCKLTTLNLVGKKSISESSKESLRAILKKYRPDFKLEI